MIDTERVLFAIEHFWKQYRRAPSLADTTMMIKTLSPRTVNYHVEKLIRAGKIRKIKK